MYLLSCHILGLLGTFNTIQSKNLAVYLKETDTTYKVDSRLVWRADVTWPIFLYKISAA